MNKALAISFAVGCVRAFNDSLEDCETVAAMFDNTCTEEIDVADWASATSNQVDCEGPNICVESNTYDDSEDFSCSHQQKLCVTCEQTNTVWMRV